MSEKPPEPPTPPAAERGWLEEVRSMVKSLQMHLAGMKDNDGHALVMDMLAHIDEVRAVRGEEVMRLASKSPPRPRPRWGRNVSGARN
jgi:hypothetical protein